MHDSYEEVLSHLSQNRPRVARVLQSAHEHRQATSLRLVEGARFKRLEELLSHLDVVENGFKEHPRLKEVAFLVERARGDFETAIEATLSGYVSVAVDAMRGVIEIENLLLDFSLAQDRVSEWLKANSAVLRKRFKAVDVRKRLATAGIGNVGDRAESVDYAAHSAALHVSPVVHPLARKGFVKSEGFEGDSGFWEIFEHSRRLLNALDRLMDLFDDESVKDVPRMNTLKDLEDAWRRTQEMQALFLALWQAAAEAAGSIESD